ncbi:MAG: efflux RND transporter periplasmic adaptor subunit [Cytophagaceae bacterium]
MKKNRWLIIVFILIGIVLLIIINPFSRFLAEEQPEIKPPSAGIPEVIAVVATPELLENKINITGTVLPNEEVQLRSEATGRITSINFTEDSPVTKGQLLVKINDRDLKAQLSKIKVQEKLASDDEYRKRKLLEINGISQEEYDRAANLVKTLQADVELLEAQIAKTEIRAPFNGVVGLRFLSEGGYVSPNDLVASIQELNPVKIEFNVPERYADLVRKGSAIKFSVAGSDKLYSGTVYAASTSIDLNTRTLTVRAKAPNPDRSLTPGSFVKISFTLQLIKDALLLPSEAVVPELGGQKIFVISADTVRSVKVQTGIRTEDAVQIISGISANDTVPITGLLQLKDGAKVRIKEISERKELQLRINPN